MKKIVLFTLLCFISIFGNAQNWKSHPKKPYSSTDSCLVFQDSTKKFYRVKCSEIGGSGSGGTSDSTLSIQVKYAESITKGQAVYVSGGSGTNIEVSKASNTTEATSSKTLGLAMEPGSTNHIARIITDGILGGLNTDTAAIGEPVWLGTSGNLIYGLTGKPVAPAHLVYMGVVTRAHATQGEIFVKIQNGFELREIHDVLITSPADNQVLTYESATSLWKNKLVDLTSINLDNGKIPVGDGTNKAFGRTPSGAVTMDNLGVFSYNDVVPSNKGGAGTVNGILKANGSGVVSQAVANVDYQYASYYDVRRYGAVADGITDNTTAFNNCLADMDSNETMFIPEGYWVGEIILDKGIHILGAGVPQLDSVTDLLKGGTVILGYIDLHSEPNASVQKLGLDQTNSTRFDGITCGFNFTTRTLNHVIRDIVCKGRGYTGIAPFTSGHGIHAESGKNALIQNIKAYRYAHGTSMKVSNSNVSDCYYEDCVFDGLIVKSDNGHPLVENININNIVAISKSASTQSALYVQGYDSGTITRNVNINNFVSDNSTGRGVYVQCVAGSTVDNINFTNCIVSDVANSAYEVIGLADYVSFDNCQAINAGDYSFENGTGTNVQLIGYRSVAPTTGDISGTFTQNEINVASVRATSLERISTSTNSNVYPLTVRARSTGSIADNFGVGIGLQVIDTDEIVTNLGLMQFRRVGADNTSYFQLNTFNAGVSSTGLYLSPTSNLGIGRTTALSKLHLSGYCRSDSLIGTGTRDVSTTATGIIIAGRLSSDRQAKVSATQLDRTDASPVNIPNLTADLLAGRTYVFEATIPVTLNVTGGGRFIVAAGTATATSINTSFSFISSSTITSTTSTTYGGHATITGLTSGVMNIKGSIVVNTAGTFILQFRQETASGTSSVLINSSLKVEAAN